MKHKKAIKIIRQVLIVIIVIMLLIPKYNTYEDGGTKTYTSLTYKLIFWNEIEGKQEELLDGIL